MPDEHDDPGRLVKNGDEIRGVGGEPAKRVGRCHDIDAMRREPLDHAGPT